MAGASGCVRRDPTVAAGEVATGTATPPPPAPDLARHAAAQAALASAAAAGTAGSNRLGAFRLRAAHDLAAQAELLAPGTASPGAPGDFATAARAAAADLLAAPARGTTAARLASAGAYAGAVGALASTDAPRTPTEAASADTVPAGGDAEAMTGLLLQLYPAVYALETALALATADDAGWIRTTLDAHVTARQELLAELARRSLRAPVAEVAYDVGEPAGPEDAIRLVARVEASVLPAACRLVRATVEERLRALGATVLHDATVATALAGGALPTWPGWA
ncbi:protein of unknown function [Raineyella antarctica]|uniref:DUF4439 domain-containing protein n=2 Tax=Raineyella antarctica TaxID=1577474 RepID=A0A1G6HBB2_9ACTN|nr:protein of unknown function [Raineyella antarctica]